MAEEKLTNLALASRFIVLILQCMANWALPDHHNDDVFMAVVDMEDISKFTWLDRVIHKLFAGLRHWDGEYFLHIAQHSYTYENTLAFYPLYPMLVRHVALFFNYFGFGISLSSWILMVAVFLNVFFFCKATTAVYGLTIRVYNDPNKAWYVALLFCFNPASIFFSAAYSEAIYCWLTFALMRECCGEMRFIRTVVPLALSYVSRSNGLLNAGYPLYFMLRSYVLRKTTRLGFMFKTLACLTLSFIPLTLFNLNAFMQFCLDEQKAQHSQEILAYADKKGYVLAGAGALQSNPEQSSWCKSRIPMAYTYVQAHYWNVGFLRYYELKQLPNFLLATPVICFMLYHCYHYFKRLALHIWPNNNLADILKQCKSIPFVVHALLITLFSLLFVHIQVSTRLICAASPCLYWFAADYMPKTFDEIKLRSQPGAILLWFACYYLVGTVAFCNNLPWT